MYWYDTIARVGRGAKRHIYESSDINDRTIYRRVCGTSDSGGANASVDSKRHLTYTDMNEIITDPNACERCLSSTGLDAVDPPSRGADAVDYDPFGVNDE